MVRKGTKLYSVTHATCPRCQEGAVFVHKQPYSSLSFGKMHSHCSHCGQAFEPEPGFYQGAMYVSYALSLITCFIITGVFIALNGSNVWILATALGLVLLALLPLMFRVSRLVWLNIFVNFDASGTQTNRAFLNRA